MTAQPQALCETDVERYFVLPGMIGGDEIGYYGWRAARAKALRNGGRNDLASFHDQALKFGPLPQALLESQAVAPALVTSIKSAIARKRSAKRLGNVLRDDDTGVSAGSRMSTIRGVALGRAQPQAPQFGELRQRQPLATAIPPG
jgi:hypothetical protein